MERQPRGRERIRTIAWLTGQSMHARIREMSGGRVGPHARADGAHTRAELGEAVGPRSDILVPRVGDSTRRVNEKRARSARDSARRE